MGRIENMKKNIVLLAILAVLTVQGQYKIEDGSALLDLQKVPLEKMYVHVSSPFVFSGEYLYYKVYCINAQTNRLSTISSMAYVALIDSKGQKVFEHKLRLERGMGQGDVFVNTDLRSGNYKLVGYTQWMKNGGLDQIFKVDIAIVNPYLADQSAILDSKMGSEGQPDIPSSVKEEPVTHTQTKNSPLQLQIDTTVYKTREKISLTVRNYGNALGHGNYSIVVKKKEDLGAHSGLSAETYASDYFNAMKRIPQSVGDSIYLPEQRGELVYGRVIDKSNGVPAVNKEVVISIPGKEFLLKSATTDSNGNFFAYLRKEYKRGDALFQVIEEGDFEISIGNQKSLKYSGLDFGQFTVDTADAEIIKSRSLHNQIENAYFSAKPDSILQLDLIDPFDGAIPEVFDLDAYTRFPTLQETMIEILNTVGYRNVADGKDYIRVAQFFEKFNEPYNDFPAIVLIDGVFIPDHSKIKDFNANKIKYIKIVRDQLVMGSKQYQGIVSIETKNGDFVDDYRSENAETIPLAMPRAKKNYFNQSYNGIENRIPDYRHLLFWQPSVTIDSPELTINFYASDVTGEFEIIFEGFTSYGKPISLKKALSVQ